MENDKKVRAVVINSVDAKEADKNIILYSLEEGKIHAQAKGIRKAMARLKAGAQLFSFGEFILAERGGMYVLTGCTPEESFSGLCADEKMYYAGMLVLELLNNCTNEREPCPRLFISSIKALSALVYSGADAQAVKLKFMLDVLAFGGYSQDFKCCSECGGVTASMYYDAERGLLCSGCSGRAALISKQVLSALAEAAVMDYDSLKITEGINGAIRVMRETIEHNYKIRIKSII